jgi:hypothetical protein
MFDASGNANRDGRVRLSFVALTVVLFAVQGESAGRYTVARDPASRYGFQYVRDLKTGRWVQREFEIRVDLARDLPDLRADSDVGNRFSVQLFKPGTAQTGGLRSAVPVVEDGFRVWRGADVMDKHDLDGKVAYGVSVSWPQAGSETKYDPMEIFSLSSLAQTEPERWSAWMSAAALRSGAMGWWDQTMEKPVIPAPPPAHPFELRWRLVFAEIPGRIP